MTKRPVYIVRQTAAPELGRHKPTIAAYSAKRVACNAAVKLLAKFPIIESPDGAVNGEQRPSGATYLKRQLEHWNDATIYGINEHAETIDSVTVERIDVH